MKKVPFLSCFFCVLLVSCSTKQSGYVILYEGDEVILKNNKGSITFPEIGNVIIHGECIDGAVMPGSYLTMVNSDEEKDQTVVFEYALQDSTIQISTMTVYKRDCVIEYDGIIGNCAGDIGFERDRNVFVCGTPVLVGYTDNTKKHFAICPEYGYLTPYYSKLEEKQYITKTIKAGDTLAAKLIVFNSNERPIRMLCQPDGYSATFTIAAHADRAKSLVSRAILWGTSDTASVDYGKKGMLSNGVVGTVSVFAKHTEQFREAEAIEVSYYKELMDEAYSQGLEICPHTISYNPDNRVDFAKYLPIMAENYHCRNWIDHYLRENNPSSGLHSAGGLMESDYYIMDLLQQYGYQYCWSYVDVPNKGEDPGDQLWNGHYMFPRHLVYQNEHLAFPDGTPIFQYKNTWEQLENLIVSKKGDPVRFMESLIEKCGVWTDHCYLLGEFEKLYEVDNGRNVYRILPKLETFFEYVGEKKKEGIIWNPTMSEFCDYMVKLENVSISRLSRGVYQITNNNSEPVNCSFVYNGKGDVVLNGEPMNSKQNGNGMVFWGNVEVGGWVIC